MKKIIVLILCMSIFLLKTKAQDSTFNDHDSLNKQQAVTIAFHDPAVTHLKSPYKIRFVDAPVIAASIGLTAYGVHLIDTKEPLSEEELSTMSKQDIPFFDRGNAGFYSPTA